MLGVALIAASLVVASASSHRSGPVPADDVRPTGVRNQEARVTYGPAPVTVEQTLIDAGRYKEVDRFPGQSLHVSKLRSCEIAELTYAETQGGFVDKQTELELYRRQAEIAKVLANPVRLHILNLIGDKEVASVDLLDELGVSKANLSQHLGVLRTAGVVAVRREGAHVFYRLTFPEIKNVCAAMRDILAKYLNESGRQGRLLMRQAR